MTCSNYLFTCSCVATYELLTGVETSESMTCAEQEVHISGDIVFAIMQYLWASGNATMFTKEAFGNIIIGIGDFWISRSQYNATRQLYDITGMLFVLFSLDAVYI